MSLGHDSKLATLPLREEALMATASASTPANIYPCLFYDDAPAAIDWLERAFGFVRRLVVAAPDGSIHHAELSFGTGVIMVASSRPQERLLSPRGLAGIHLSLCVQVDDPDAHCKTARSAGAEIIQDPVDTDYGARGYAATDLEGNHWYFGNYRPGTHWQS